MLKVLLTVVLPVPEYLFAFFFFFCFLLDDKSRGGRNLQREVGLKAQCLLTPQDALLTVLVSYGFCNKLPQAW